ncbi:MAG TPA: c-type cytochrome [Burkholderiales bacterium]|nr:c-type cytochrome [Burkholderiales bacterium]
MSGIAAALLLCAGCHGMSGEGRLEAGYPPIAGQPPAYLERQLEAYADGRRESAVMSPLAKRLAAEERAQLAAHFASQKKPGAPVPAGSERGRILATLGDNALRVQACQNCHGPGGTAIPPFTPYLAGLHPDYLRRELLAFRSGARRTDPSGQMSFIAQHLTAEDIAAVAAHYGARLEGDRAGH